MDTMPTSQLVSDVWTRTDLSDAERDAIVSQLLRRTRIGDPDAWPLQPMAEREGAAGLYPDPSDPMFAARLFAKKEFHDSRAVAAAAAEGTLDPCTSAAANAVFELTPVQRIVSRFMNPATPYMGMLLYHGVGVGKTCSAVTIAEQFLQSAPHKKVIVIVPQALKANFRRTVFDIGRIRWSDEEGQWQSDQCTGTSYLERLDLMQTQDARMILYKTDEDRRNRYTITGYQAFANWIKSMLERGVPKGLTDPVARRVAEDEILRRLFSDHLIIIDEAHNLRDTADDAGGVAGATEAGAAIGDAAENAGGKALNPYLRRIVTTAEGLRLVLMTATPMYNAAQEILLLLNYLIMNDSKSERSALRVEEYFTKDGDLTTDPARLRILSRFMRRYVSYMRGENPYTFPLRLRPEAAAAMPAEEWPAVSATKTPVEFTEEERAAMNRMPLVFTEPVAGSPPEVLLREATSRAQIPEGTVADEDAPVLADAMLDARMQMANISYPNLMSGRAGWDSFFETRKVAGKQQQLRAFSPVEDVDSVFVGEGLRRHAPKIHRIVESMKRARGICFAYSRYIKAGALPLAVALERAGFQRRMADGSFAPLLVDVSRPPPICAICGERDGAEHEEGGAHPFRPACYVLLTSEQDLSPRFADLVRVASSWDEDPAWGPVGGQVKVILGSQVASEGLDLKCIREMHVLDAWYHLNRIDQIVGRAIRYCSHAALRAVERRDDLTPMSMNNCLIYLHALRVGEGEVVPVEGSNAAATAGAGGGGDGAVSGKLPAFEGQRKLPAFETADMYAYRLAVRKALKVGVVQRQLKIHAWDCNLEFEAIIFAGLPKRLQVDAQGRVLDEYSIDDQDYTTYCDYQSCAYQCAIAVPADVRLDTSTFGISDARRTILAKQELVRALFQDQVVVPETVIQEIFTQDLPWEIASEALMELLDGRKFRLRRADGTEGFLMKKAGYVVFQPTAITDTEIPLTLRYARAFQLRRRFLEPAVGIFQRAEEPRMPAVEPRMPAVEPRMPAVEPRMPVAEPRMAAAEPPPPVSMSNAAAAYVPPPMPEAAAVAREPAVLSRWNLWLAFVRSKGTAPLPAGLPATTGIWSWILERYAEVSQAQSVALRWWFDKQTTYAERRALYEFILDTPMTDVREDLGILNAMFETDRDILRSKQTFAYRIFNPETVTVESFCRSTALPLGTPYTPCSSRFAEALDAALGNTPVRIPDDVGSLFGFLMNKKGAIVFKTFDTTKPKKHSTFGAECGNTSNLSEHHPRVRLLQDAGRTSPLAPFMLPDDDESWDKTGLKERQMSYRPVHMKDITHQPLCIYMEFLTRMLDVTGVSGRRWFLSAVAATQSGLKSKKLE
jgi:hypothetical protein